MSGRGEGSLEGENKDKTPWSLESNSLLPCPGGPAQGSMQWGRGAARAFLQLEDTEAVAGGMTAPPCSDGTGCSDGPPHPGRTGCPHQREAHTWGRSPALFTLLWSTGGSLWTCQHHATSSGWLAEPRPQTAGGGGLECWKAQGEEEARAAWAGGHQKTGRSLLWCSFWQTSDWGPTQPYQTILEASSLGPRAA